MTGGIESLTGRARSGGGRETYLSVRVQAATKTTIDEIARQRGWTRSDTVRHLLQRGIDANEMSS